MRMLRFSRFRRGGRWRAATAGVLALVAGAAPGVAGARDIVAVVSSDLRPYTEAVEGLREFFPDGIDVINLERGRPTLDPATRVVVAVGGRAAREAYPAHVDVVYCMAPGTQLDGSSRQMVEIEMLPHPRDLARHFSEIQPGARSMAVLSVSPNLRESLERLGEALEARGVRTESVQMDGPEALPSTLRGLLKRRPDAIWIPPDPLLVNSRNLEMLREFSWSNRIPLYVPTAGLVKGRAVASISTSFRDLGRTAGEAAVDLLEGRHVGARIHPSHIEVVLDLNAALKTGLEIPGVARNKASMVLR